MNAGFVERHTVLGKTPPMTATIEVLAGNNRPFTHVGPKVIVAEVDVLDKADDVRVRAWPLEWVNESSLDVVGVALNLAAPKTQLGVNDFRGFRRDRWP